MSDSRIILTHSEAEAVGEALYAHWMRIYGDAIHPAGSLAWADVVQFVCRQATATTAARDGGSD